MKVLDVMGPSPPFVTLRAFLLEAAELMTRAGTSMVPVCDNDRFVGLITDRIIVLNAFAEGRDPRTTRLVDLMPLEDASVSPDQTLSDARRVLQEHHLKRAPVVDNSRRLVGSLSLVDLLAAAPAVEESPPVAEESSLAS